MTAQTGSRRQLLISGARMATATAMLPAWQLAKAAVAGAIGTPLKRGDTVGLAFDPEGRVLFRAAAAAVSRSDDDGHHWADLELPTTGAPATVTSVAVAPAVKGALYVAGLGIGVLRSDDGGLSWRQRNDGLASLDVATLTAHADRPETVYAYINGKGIFRSEDGGEHWRLMDAGPRGRILSLVHSNMPGSMQSGWLFAATTDGVQRAMDCFCGWRDAGELRQPVTAVAYDKQQAADIYAASNADLFFSDDGGEKWKQTTALQTPIRALAIAPGGVIYASGADGKLYRRSAGATQWGRTDA
jgi:photosystem II stability/assembly factor-like uncharacterized protein